MSVEEESAAGVLAAGVGKVETARLRASCPKSSESKSSVNPLRSKSRTRQRRESPALPCPSVPSKGLSEGRAYYATTVPLK